MFVVTARSVRKAFAANTFASVTVFSAVAAAMLVLDPAAVNAKTPGTVHCYGGYCHRINSIDEMDDMVGRRGFVTASFYDDCSRDRFNPCGLTSSGAVFRPDMPDNAASPIFPDGTVLLTYNPETKLAAVVRVTSTGPYRGDRTLDVSRATAEHLGFAKRGVAPLEIVVLKSPEEQEARYKKLREYAPVPGFIGRFDSFEAAYDHALSRLRMETLAVTVALSASTNNAANFVSRLAAGLFQNLPDEADKQPASPASVALVAAVPAIQLTSRGSIETLSLLPPTQILSPRDVAAEVVASDFAEPPSWTDRLAAVITQAQLKARLGRSASPIASNESQASLPITERLLSFVRDAQTRARLAKLAMDDVLAER